LHTRKRGACGKKQGIIPRSKVRGEVTKNDKSLREKSTEPTWANLGGRRREKGERKEEGKRREGRRGERGEQEKKTGRGGRGERERYGRRGGRE